MHAGQEEDSPGGGGKDAVLLENEWDDAIDLDLSGDAGEMDPLVPPEVVPEEIDIVEIEAIIDGDDLSGPSFPDPAAASDLDAGLTMIVPEEEGPDAMGDGADRALPDSDLGMRIEDNLEAAEPEPFLEIDESAVEALSEPDLATADDPDPDPGAGDPPELSLAMDDPAPDPAETGLVMKDDPGPAPGAEDPPELSLAMDDPAPAPAEADLVMKDDPGPAPGAGDPPELSLAMDDPAPAVASDPDAGLGMTASEEDGPDRGLPDSELGMLIEDGFEAAEPEPFLEVDESAVEEVAEPDLVMADDPGRDPADGDFFESALEIDAPEPMGPDGAGLPVKPGPAGAEDGSEDDFDLSFGIEIEERPPAAPGLVDEAATRPDALDAFPAGAGGRQCVAARAPVPFFKKRLHLPLPLVAAVLFFLFSALGALIWLGLRPAAQPPETAGINVFGLHGRVVENALAGPVFVVSGQVRNDTGTRRRRIRVRGRLFTQNGFVKTRTAYCGNALTEKDLATLDPAIVKRLSANPAGDGGVNENLPAGRSLPFTLVFNRLPENLESLDKYTVEIDHALR